MIKPVGTPFDDPFAGIPEGVEKPEDEDGDVFPPGEEPFSLDEFETEYEVEEEEDLTGAFREECDRFFAPGGTLEQNAAAAGLKCELRPQQRAMADAIAEAFCSGEHLCVEAPTGVGKSFAYLVPLVFRARRKCRPAVISTGTINLQEQLIGKDIPFLSKLLGIEIKAALAKGRRNYVCRRRLAMLSGEQKDLLIPNPSMALDLERVTRDLEQKGGGSREDFNFRLDPEIWNLICCETGNCMRAKCPHFRNCCYFEARRQWEEADIIVANHALFFTDLSMRYLEGAAGALLPNYGAVLFDEAHDLEDAAANHLGVHLSRPAVVGMLNRIYNPDNAKGLLMRAHGVDPAVRGLVAETRDESYGFFANFEELLRRSDETALEITHPEHFVDNLTQKLMDLAGQLQKIADDEDEEDNSFKTEIESMLSRCRECVDCIATFMHRTMDKAVYYAEEDSGGMTLHVTPLNVAELLDERLFNGDFTIVLCSATLTVRNRFDYFVGRTGFEGRTLQLDSPFSPDQAKVRVIRRMPDPKSAEYRKKLADEILSSLKLTDGKAFVLFTSYDLLHWCAETLHDEFLDNDWQLLVQGTQSRTRLLREFREDVNSVLFGTDSFWTGVDVPGEALSHVIITKLPFAVPSHPLTAARLREIDSRGASSFNEYSLPEAVLKFRQGAGRLIRNRDDRGYITILDPRMITRNYGKVFLESLPYRSEIIN